MSTNHHTPIPDGSAAKASTINSPLSELDAAITAIDASDVNASLFDAHTILKADTDNTPAALTVAEQTLVGRITAGNITALTATQVRTLLNVANGADVTGSNPPQAHAASHVDGTDDIQDATALQKGLMTSAYASKLDGIAAGAQPGTVTSVALTAPTEVSVGGSPITGSGTLALTWADQSANEVFAGPSSGVPATPGFRTLVADDIPSLDASKIGSGTLALSLIPSTLTGKDADTLDGQHGSYYRDADNLNAGTVALARGGVGADLSATGPGFLQQGSNGAAVTLLKHNIGAASAPTANDDSGSGYAVGSLWIDTTADKSYLAQDVTATAAVWADITSAGVTDHGALSGLSDDDHTGYLWLAGRSTQTISDEIVINGAQVGVVTLTVNAPNGQTANVIEWQVNGTDYGYINSSGEFVPHLNYTNAIIIGEGHTGLRNGVVVIGDTLSAGGDVVDGAIVIGVNGSRAGRTGGISIGHNVGNGAIGSTTSQGPVFIGDQAGNDIEGGVAIGRRALQQATGADYSTAVGHYAGRGITGGSGGHLFLGRGAGGTTWAATHGSTVSDKLVIANTDTATPLIQGDFSVATLDINGELSMTNIIMPTSDANVSNPPTDAELDAAFGTPATVGDGFAVLIDDAGGGANGYLVWSDGANWMYVTGTIA